jgi:hypothetical protein
VTSPLFQAARRPGARPGAWRAQPSRSAPTARRDRPPGGNVKHKPHQPLTDGNNIHAVSYLAASTWTLNMAAEGCSRRRLEPVPAPEGLHHPASLFARMRPPLWSPWAGPNDKGQDHFGPLRFSAWRRYHVRRDMLSLSQGFLASIVRARSSIRGRPFFGARLMRTTRREDHRRRFAPRSRPSWRRPAPRRRCGVGPG